MARQLEKTTMNLSPVLREEAPFFSAKQLSYAYGNHHVIKNISLHICDGEIRGIIGPNGAGKTTLIKLLSGEMIPQQGSVSLQNEDITKLPPNLKRRLGISRSFQIINIFQSHTVFECVRLAVQANHQHKYNIFLNIEKIDEIVKDTHLLLDQCHLSHVKDVVCTNLSYAEQRQIEIALCLAGNPKLLLLDEPAAGLSKEESKSLAHMISELAREKQITILLIEHDMDIVFSICDMISVIHQGTVLVEGSPEEVKINPKVKEIYLGEESDA